MQCGSGSTTEIGTLEKGRWADLVVLDPTATPVLKDRDALSNQVEDTLFALAILGDDRAVRATYVAGRQVWDACSEGRIQRNAILATGGRICQGPGRGENACT